MVVDLIYFVSISLSMVVGGYILFKIKTKHHHQHLQYLGLYFILNALCFSFFLLIKYGFINYAPFLYKITAPLTYLILPLSYFHVRALTRHQLTLSWRDSIHFVLFFIFLISYWEFYGMSLSEKEIYVSRLVAQMDLTYQDDVGIIPEFVNNIGRVVQPFFYLLLQWILVYQYIDTHHQKSNSKIYHWVKNFTLLQTVYFILLVVTVIVGFIAPNLIENEILGQVTAAFTAILFFWLSLYLLWNQDVLTVLRNFKTFGDKEPAMTLAIITETVKTENFFLEENLNLTTLARRLNMSGNDLSKLINQSYPGYNKWINKIRVNYSIELIKSGVLDHYSVEALANQSGFKSKNTFYRAFKEQTNMTPTALKKQMLS